MITRRDILVGNVYLTDNNERWECVACKIPAKKHIPEKHIFLAGDPIFKVINLQTQQQIIGTFEMLPKFIMQWKQK